MLPQSLKPALLKHLEKVRALHDADLKAGAGRVVLPDALSVKYPNADREWGWQYVFPASSRYVEQPSGIPRRHHLHESVVQKAMKQAVRQGKIAKPASCHTMRHSFATIFWRLATISEPSRNCWGTGTSGPLDLHPCPQSGRPRRQKPRRSPVGSD